MPEEDAASRTALEHKDGKLRVRVQMPMRGANLGGLMTDKKPPKKPRASQKPSPIDELRQMVEEDIE